MFIKRTKNKKGKIIQFESNEINNNSNNSKEEKTENSLNDLRLTQDEATVFNNIAIENMGVDEILKNTSLKFEDLMLILTTLEIKGLIKQIDGGKYQSVVKI